VKPKHPLFSIVIPTYDRPRQLSACLQAVNRLDYPRDQFEVIIADDGSQSPLEAVVASFADRMNITLTSQKHSCPAAARNTGADLAKGDYLAFTDDDCAPASDWLTMLKRRFAETPNNAIGGRILNLLHNNPYSSLSQMIIDAVYDYYNDTRSQARFFVTNNLAVPKKLFCSVGGFNANFKTSEDREFCDRWLSSGYHMTYAPEVVIYHANLLTMASFWRQHFNYGRGSFCFHQLRARRQQKRMRLEPLSFYFHLLKYPLSKKGQVPRGLGEALLLLSQAASTSGFAWEFVKQRIL